MSVLSLPLFTKSKIISKEKVIRNEYNTSPKRILTDIHSVVAIVTCQAMALGVLGKTLLSCCPTGTLMLARDTAKCFRRAHCLI